jgi:hypothetical protein
MKYLIIRVISYSNLSVNIFIITINIHNIVVEKEIISIEDNKETRLL